MKIICVNFKSKKVEKEIKSSKSRLFKILVEDFNKNYNIEEIKKFNFRNNYKLIKNNKKAA